jgi:hypothetical protein
MAAICIMGVIFPWVVWSISVECSPSCVKTVLMKGSFMYASW